MWFDVHSLLVYVVFVRIVLLFASFVYFIPLEIRQGSLKICYYPGLHNYLSSKSPLANWSTTSFISLLLYDLIFCIDFWLDFWMS